MFSVSSLGTYPEPVQRAPFDLLLRHLRQVLYQSITDRGLAIDLTSTLGAAGASARYADRSKRLVECGTVQYDSSTIRKTQTGAAVEISARSVGALVGRRSHARSTGSERCETARVQEVFFCLGPEETGASLGPQLLVNGSCCRGVSFR